MILDELTTNINWIIWQTKNNLNTLGIILLIPWCMYVLILLNHQFLLLGIIPRRLRGIPGIMFAPLLHANFNHLFFNSIPLFVLSNFILTNGLMAYLQITFIITLLSGLAIWCFAKPGVHVGASALITGYWGFLVLNIYQNPSIIALILGLLSIYYFAGIFLGIFPSEKACHGKAISLFISRMCCKFTLSFIGEYAILKLYNMNEKPMSALKKIIIIGFLSLSSLTLNANSSCCAKNNGIRYCDSSSGRFICNNGTTSACYCTRHAVMDLQLLSGCCLWKGGVMLSYENTGIVTCNDGSISEECSLSNTDKRIGIW